MRRTSDQMMLGFHWLTSLLVAAAFAIGWLHAHGEVMDDLAGRTFWLDVHRSIGLTILALTVARLLTRMRFGPVPKGSELALPLRIASRATHFLIYACLIAMPLLGWAESSAQMRHLKVFGVAIPRLVRHDADLGDTLAWWHAQVGWLFFSLIALHALAALFHHYVLRDEVLVTMVPGRKKPPVEASQEWPSALPESRREAA